MSWGGSVPRTIVSSRSSNATASFGRNLTRPRNWYHRPASPPTRRSHCFVGCSAAGPTSTRCAGRARPPEKLGTRRLAPTNGRPASAKSRASSAPNVRTGNSCRSRTRSCTSTSPGRSSSASTRSCRTTPAISWRWTSTRLTGARMRKDSCLPAATLEFPPRWKSRAPARVRMYGSSSPLRSRRATPGSWARPSSVTPARARGN